MSCLALAQRRQLDLHPLEPVVEVLAEPPLADQRLQVLVGRGHQPHVHRDRPPAAHARDLPLLERAQQPHLEGGLHVADLVEEERAAVGQLELARPGLDAGRHAALDAEQLALEQRLGERRAVDGDQRPLAAREDGGGASPPAPCRCRSRRAPAR